MAGRNYIKTSLTRPEDGTLPTVALVGRPNVGKSTLFNRLTHSRRAIVDPTPGMTRDRLYGSIHRDGGSFRLIDTGGLEERPDRIVSMIRNQTERAIAEADLIVFLLDGREGVTAADEEIAAALRLVDKPKLLFANKMDAGEDMLYDTAIHALGFEETLFGSAEHNLGIAVLLELIDDRLERHWARAESAAAVESTTEGEEDPTGTGHSGTKPIRLAIIGRPNAGKSSIVNRLLKEERVMVSDIPGTTRDPIDSFLQYSARTFCLVDTAGIRRKGRISDSQESLSVMMATRQVEQADVIVLMIDATDSGTAQDATIAGIADKAFKPIVVVVNKWDLIEDKKTDTPRRFEEQIRRRLKFLETSPFVFISALTGQRVTRVLDLALRLHDRAGRRVTTGVLNRLVESLSKSKRMPSHSGRLLKVFYMTQVGVHPPTFMAVVNQRKALHFTQERFLINRVREAFDLDGVPIRLKIKPRSRKE